MCIRDRAHPEHQLWGKVKARENSCYLLEKEDDEFLYVKDLCSEDELSLIHI